MKFQPITLQDQSLISTAWKKICLEYDLRFAEYSFANVYLFRKKYDHQVVNCETVCVRGTFKNGNYYFIPSVPPLDIKLKLPQSQDEKKYCFYPLPDVWRDDLQKLNMDITSCRADTDYLFHVSKLQTLSGRELSSRRNLLHQLERNAHLESFSLEGKEIDNAFLLLEEWQQNRKEHKEKTDYYSCKEALELLSQLNLFGRIAYSDGKPVGFTIGELLTPTTALLHFAKSLHHIKGATPYLYKDFATHLPESVTWINLEQDLGIPALRKAKEAYAPDILLTKWKAC